MRHGSELSLLTLEGAFPAYQSIAAGQGVPGLPPVRPDR